MEKQIQTIKTWLGSGSINIFGDPFAGKDTQAEILAELLGTPAAISGGAIMRALPPDSQEQKEMATGDTVSSDLYLRIISPYLAREEFVGKPLMLSTVGRKEGEEGPVMAATEKTGHPMKAVILLSLSEEEVWRRFEAAQADGDRGLRADDTRETLAVRLQVYKEQTMPVINFYREQGLLIEVDGQKSVEDVTNEIVDELYLRAINFTK